MKNKYTVSEKIKTLIFLVITKLFYKNARLIRRPFILRGKKQFEYGRGFTTGYNCRIETFKISNETKLTLGKNVRIGDNVHIACGSRVDIGDNVLIASKVYISDISHGTYKEFDEKSSPLIPPNERPLITSSVIVGDNVWIGEGVSILAGSRIGSGSIIGANSVVVGEIPENVIAVGTPAKIIKKYNMEKKLWERINTYESS